MFEIFLPSLHGVSSCRRTLREIILVLFLAICINSFSQQSPLHQRVAASKNDKVYDTKEWGFSSGSPVRSTPLIQGATIYFGNTAGVFFAIDKKSAQLRWKFNAGSAIHSSAIATGDKVYFADNRQTVYALDKGNGKLKWSFNMGSKKDYPWRFDYYYSSPVLHNGKLFIGGDDGYLYALHPETGKLIWKFSTNGIVRSTPAIYKNLLLFGDTEASLYAVNIETGKQAWIFRINGDTMKNENYGFDRRAITSSVMMGGNKAIFGARDGYLYCINADNGESLWKADHRVSWVISTVAIKDTTVVTGTSDGRFVQALHLETGRELWRYRTAMAVWASPLIVDKKVYAAAFDGQLHCIDLRTGKRISQYKTDAMMLSSPVWSDDRLYVGSDDGNLYAFSGHADKRLHTDKLNRYVFYETGINIYFRGGSDLRIRNYLNGNGYKTLGTDSLTAMLSNAGSGPAVIVFASDYFPRTIIENGKESLLRKFLERGGKIVLAGIIPTVYKIDDKTKQPVDFNKLLSDSIFGLHYGHGDTRSFMGQYPSFPTPAGKMIGLPDFWINSLFIDESNVDVVLGKNENGWVSAFAKNYSNGGQLVQLWMDPDKPERMDAIIKAAEWRIDNSE
jgi:eukaryotic-like serine/threonine-protein kinase